MSRQRMPEWALARAVTITVLIAAALIWAGFKACERIDVEPERYPATENYTDGFTQSYHEHTANR